MKQSKKILCILLVVIMAFSSISIGVSAQWTDYRTAPASRDVHGDPVMSSAQRASLLLDYVDAMLEEKQIVKEIDYKVGSITFDARSIDKALDSIVNIYTSGEYSLIEKLGLGDLEDLNYSRIRGGYRRTTAGITDVDLLYQLVQFANDNRSLIAKYITGTLDLGFLNDMVELKAPELSKKVNLSLYNSLWDSAATEVPTSVNADQMLQHFVDVTLLGGVDKDGETVEGKLPSMTGQTSLTAYSLYQFVENAANAAMTDIVLPMVNGKVKRQLQEFFGVEFASDDDTVGDWSKVDPKILEQVNLNFNITNYTWGSTTEGIFGQINDFIGTIMDQVFIGEPGLWQKGSNSLIDDNLARVCLYLYENYGDELLPAGFDKKPQAEVEAMSVEQLVCYIGSAFIEKEFDYIKLPDNITTMEELVCRLLLEVAAEVVPEQNYWGKIEFGQLTIGRDLIFQIISDIARYYINAYTPINVKQGLDFNSTILACVNWALDNERYGGFFTSTGVTSTSSGTAWQKLDNTIFKIIPISLFGPTVTGSQNLVMDHLFNSILDLNFDSFLSIFYKNSSGPLNKTALDFVVYFLNNALKVVCGNTVIIPPKATTLTKILTDNNIGVMVNNLLSGLVAAGKPFFQSALQFITPGLKNANDVTIESTIGYLTVTAPTAYGTKTLDDLKNTIENDDAYLSGIPEDEFDADMSHWNDRIDYDLYSYRTFRDVIKDGESYIEAYEAAVKALQEAEPGTEAYTNAEAALAKFTAKTTTDTEYRIYYYMNRLAGTSSQAGSQREACVTQLLRTIDVVEKEIKASGYTQSNFTEAVWAKYQKALKFAKNVANEDVYSDEDEEFPYLKQSMVNTARRNLISTSKLLKSPSADYTMLALTIADAETRKEKDYTPESWKILSDVLVEAKAFYALGNCSIEEQNIVDAMTAKLQAAIDQLEGIVPPGLVFSDPLIANAKLGDRDMTVDGTPLVWGMDAYSSVKDLEELITLVGGAKLNIISPDGYNATTGTIIQAIYDGKVIKEYKLIIFGDTSMDSGIDEYDIGDYNTYSVWGTSNVVYGTASYIAADLTLNDGVDESDLVNVNRAFAYIGDIDQCDPRNFIMRKS